MHWYCRLNDDPLYDDCGYAQEEVEEEEEEKVQPSNRSRRRLPPC